jgi:hypothetical protein
MTPLVINDLRKQVLAIFNFFTAPDALRGEMMLSAQTG